MQFLLATKPFAEIWESRASFVWEVGAVLVYLKAAFQTDLCFVVPVSRPVCVVDDHGVGLGL